MAILSQSHNYQGKNALSVESLGSTTVLPVAIHLLQKQVHFTKSAYIPSTWFLEMGSMALESPTGSN